MKSVFVVVVAATTTAGAAGIVIGGVIAYFQHKQTRRMDQIISSKDIREQRVKTEVLRRIRRNTMGMKTILIGTRFMIRNHIQDRNKHPWEKVSEGIRLDIGKAEKRRDEIIADIGRIALLIDDHV
jgi:hypothetical protein